MFLAPLCVKNNKTQTRKKTSSQRKKSNEKKLCTVKTDTVDSVLCQSHLVSKIAAEILISALKSALFVVLCVDMIRHTPFHGVRRTLFWLQT